MPRWRGRRSTTRCRRPKTQARGRSNAMVFTHENPRAGGPNAKREPSPEGLGTRVNITSAGGAAPNHPSFGQTITGTSSISSLANQKSTLPISNLAFTRENPRAGGPNAKREPSPEGLGTAVNITSAGGAALNVRLSPAFVSG